MTPQAPNQEKEQDNEQERSNARTGTKRLEIDGELAKHGLYRDRKHVWSIEE